MIQSDYRKSRNDAAGFGSRIPLKNLVESLVFIFLLVGCTASGGEVFAQAGPQDPLNHSGFQHDSTALFTAATALHAPGTLVASENDESIYLLHYRNGKSPDICRRPIASPEVLREPYDRPGDRAQFDLSDVVLISEQELRRYAIGKAISRPHSVPDNGKPLPDGTLIRSRDGNQISIVTAGGFRKPFASRQELLDLGYRLVNVVVVDNYDDYEPLASVTRRPEAPMNLRISSP